MKPINRLIIMLLILNWGCAKTPVYKSTWQQPRLPQDGTNDDLKMHYDHEAGMMYGMSNDSENLYVYLKVPNELVQKKIMLTGLTLWIDTVAKKEKQLGLMFPVKSKSGAGPGIRPPAGRSGNPGENNPPKEDNKKFNARFASGIEGMLVLNYNGKGSTGFLNNKNSEGINATIRYDNNDALCYEAEIALNRIFSDPGQFLNDTTCYFSFGFETGKIEMAMNGNSGGRPGMRSEGGMRPGGGMGGQRGAGKGGAMNNERREQMNAMTVESKLWMKKVRLSNKLSEN